MKTKNLVIIFILFLFITLASGLVIFLTGEKEQSVLNQTGEIINSSNQPVTEGKPAEIIKDKPVLEKAVEEQPIVQPKIANEPTEEKLQAVMLINGTEYRTAMKPASSVYDLMNTLREQRKIDFKSYDYSGMGFFITEINGVKNDPAGKNWLYYINGQAAQVGVSYSKLENNDIIEWKYENKSF